MATPPQPDPQTVALALAYKQQVSVLRDALAHRVEALWRSLEVYRRPQIGTFTREITPLIAGAQRQVSAITAAYVGQQRRISIGGLSTPRAIDPKRVVGPAVRKGVGPAEVYERPFHLVWRQLDDLPREPGSIEKAIQAGMNRAVQSALTDVQLAKRVAAHDVMADDHSAVGYRRVLEGHYSCGLCIVASTQRYSKKDLLPIHPGCDCDVVPIFGDEDPGQIIDPETLENVHQRILERFGINARDARAIPDKGLPDYRDVLVIHDHGELGQVLGVRGEPFLGPEDLDVAA